MMAVAKGSGTVKKRRRPRERAFFIVTDGCSCLLHRLHLGNDGIYSITEVAVELAEIGLYSTGLRMVGTGQKLILQVEDIGQYLVGFGTVCLLYHFEYYSVSPGITSSVGSP